VWGPLGSGTWRFGRWEMGFGGLKEIGRPAGKVGGALVDFSSEVRAQTE
jgi:hypothetical protein